MTILRPGQRVRFIAEWQHYPETIVRVGETARFVGSDLAHGCDVYRLDRLHLGLDEWNNELHIAHTPDDTFNLLPRFIERIAGPAPAYLEAFPSFDTGLPDLGEGWEDTSWHNDVCPSLYHEAHRLRLWCDWKDPARREYPEAARWALVSTDPDGSFSADLLACDDLDAIKERIALAIEYPPEDDLPEPAPKGWDVIEGDDPLDLNDPLMSPEERRELRELEDEDEDEDDTAFSLTLTGNEVGALARHLLRLPKDFFNDGDEGHLRAVRAKLDDTYRNTPRY